MRDAYRNPTQEYILIIEEINRGNAPAIFGEVFQLLDRALVPKKDHEVVYPAGTSEYGITNRYMATEIYGDGGHKVRISSNLSVIGTMNTSDQNVFTLDTAFQRRWNMRLIENTFENVRPSLANANILDTEVTWKTFCMTINKLVVGNRAKMASAEDKRLGVYFVHESDLEFDDRASSPDNDLYGEYNALLRAERDENLTPEQKGRLYDIREALKKIRKFPEKVIKYLWDDAFKFMPMDLQKNIRERCHVNKNDDGDSFVGVKADTEDAMIYFPIGYQLPPNDDDLRTDINNLFNVLAAFMKEDKLIEESKFAAPRTVDFPMHAYLKVIRDFLRSGRYYIETDPRFKTDTKCGSLRFHRAVH